MSKTYVPDLDAWPVRRTVPGDPGFPQVPPSMQPPLDGLWVRGLPLEEMGACVAIVGTRTPTPYGVEVARALAGDLAAAGICVVSGMARGIDAAAHEGALAAGGRTIAVLASGVDVPSPSSNVALYERIMRSGAVISERPLGAPALKGDYPVRNRIIVGVSRAVVIVQGELRSGSSHSATWGSDMNRQVFAVPGDIRSPMSALPHALLRDGVPPCTCVGDIFAFMDNAPDREPLPLPADLAPDEETLLALLSGILEADADQLAAAAGLDAVSTSVALAELELRGLVARDLTACYRRIR